MDTGIYHSRFYQPGQGTTHQGYGAGDPQQRAAYILDAAAEVARDSDWQLLHTNSPVLRGHPRVDVFDADPAALIARAQALATARAVMADKHPDLYPGPAGPDGDGDAVLVVILDVPDGPDQGLLQAVRTLAAEGASLAIALVLVTGEPQPGAGEPYPWGFPVTWHRPPS